MSPVKNSIKPFILFIACLTSIYISLPAFGKTITLVADTWCPYNCDPGSDSPGFVIEIAQYAFENAGYNVNYQLLNWARAVEETRRGNFDGIIAACVNETPDFIFSDIEQGQASDFFYTINGSRWRYKDLDSLTGITVGIIKGYSYDEPLNSYIRANGDQFVVMHGDDALKRNIDMLLLGRITAIIENRFVMDHYISQHRIGKRIIEAGMANVENIYIAFSPAHPESKTYAAILSDGMKQLRNSGKLKKIWKNTVCLTGKNDFPDEILPEINKKICRCSELGRRCVVIQINRLARTLWAEKRKKLFVCPDR